MGDEILEQAMTALSGVRSYLEMNFSSSHTVNLVKRSNGEVVQEQHKGGAEVPLLMLNLCSGCKGSGL
jgi:hypothetical protein